MIHAYPKVFTIGQDYIKDIFKEEVEISEKIDGSQFVFGKINNELVVRSKGKEMTLDNPEKLFKIAVDYVVSIEHLIANDTVYYTEYLRTPHHNTLSYERVPKNNLILFGASDISGKFSTYDMLVSMSAKLGIECVPILFYGKITDPSEIYGYIEKESILGGTKVEGIVAKNYYRPFLLGGQPIPLMAGKFVSEKFKEIHQASWKEKSSKNKFELFKATFRAEARWLKAIQHLRDRGELINSPKDIGSLLREISSDINDEEKENIKEFLWKEFGEEILRHSQRGFPEFYKKYLLERSFSRKEDETFKS